MHIVGLYAENIKKLRAVQIKPDGSLIQITGPNEQGKSSVLDAIFYALGGAGALPAEPLRRGAEHGLIRIDTGKYIVVRKFTPEGTTLEVRSSEGARFPSPQALLDDMVGSIAFDPLAFTRMKPRDQFDTLRDLVDLGDLDIDALHAANKTDFETRTEANRQAKSLRAQAEGIPVPADLPAERVDVEALMIEMEQASQTNTLLERRKAERAAMAINIAASRAEADRIAAGVEPAVSVVTEAYVALKHDLEDQIAALQQRIDTETAASREKIEQIRRQASADVDDLRKGADEMQANLDKAEPIGEPVDVSQIRLRCDEGAKTNMRIDRRDQRQALEAAAETEEKASESLTQAMAARTKQIDDAVAAAKMPVEGLSFGDGVVLFNGLPIDQAGTAQRIRLSMAIAMACNPKLRVVIIQHGESLDESNLKLIAELAEKNDFQVFMERVDTSGAVGIVIEDGAVKGAPPPTSPEPAPRKRAAKPAEQSDAPAAGQLV